MEGRPVKRYVLAILVLLGTLVSGPVQAASASSTCRKPQLTGFSAPSLIYAGDKAKGTVALSCAPTSNIKVSLTSDTAHLTVPATVTVARGQSSVKVPVSTKLDQVGQYVAHLTASYAGQSLGAAITVNPGLKSLELPQSDKPNDVLPFVTFTGPLPAGGVTVQVASDNPAVTVPATFAFTQQDSVGGGISGVTVHPVAQETTVHISVTLGTRTLTESTVLLPPFDSGDSMQIVSQQEGDIFGLDQYLQYTVRLSNPAPEDGLRVDLKVPDDSGIQLDQDSVDVTGGFTDAGFFVHATDVTKTVHTTIEATADGVTASIPVTVQPRITDITVPTSVKGGDSFQGTVTLAGPADGDISVWLQSSWGIVDVPGPLVIPAGSTSATFTATSAPVDEPSDVFIGVYFGRNTLYSNTVTLTP
jgi:hypothetical protein